MRQQLTRLTTLAGCAVAVIPAVAKERPASKDGRPNIIFILSDDHAKNAISIFGGINAKLAPTPNIDRIGKSGVIFDNMLCTNSISGPSRASLITGKYSTTHGFYQNEGGIRFDSTQRTLPIILHENGYTTALVGKWHLYSQPMGFDYYKIHDNPGQQGTYWDPLFSTNGVRATEKGYATNLTADAALKWMDSGRDKSKPFCLLLHFKAPHRPWEPDSAYMNLYNDVDFPYPASFNDTYATREKTAGESMATIENHLSRGDLKQTPPEGLTKQERANWLWWGGSGKNQHWSPDPKLDGQELKNWKFQNYIKNYLRCVRSVDDNVGRVLDYLKANGLDKNTIVVYMGDQGFYLGEHGWYDKRWMYEESFQMPCLISYPESIKPGTELKQLALNVDITPTLLDYAGVKVPEDMQGVSMKALMNGDREAAKSWRKSAYYQYFEYPKWHNVQPHYGVRTERYKLIHFYYNVDIWEFYDLKKDPNEMTNRIDDPAYKKTISELKGELTNLQKQYHDDLPLAERRKLTDRYMLKYEE